jgi:hypothetical protein
MVQSSQGDDAKLASKRSDAEEIDYWRKRCAELREQLDAAALRHPHQPQGGAASIVEAEIARFEDDKRTLCPDCEVLASLERIREAIAALPSPQAAGVGASDLIDRAALLKKLKAERDAFVSENFVTDPETGASEASQAKEEHLYQLEETIEAIELLPAAAMPPTAALTPLPAGRLSEKQAKDIATEIVWHVQLDARDRIVTRHARNYDEIEKRIIDRLIKSQGRDDAHEKLVAALTKIRTWLAVEQCAEPLAIADEALIAAGVTEVACSTCDGVGEWDEGPLPATSAVQIDPEYRQVICPDCAGSGRTAIARADAPTTDRERL